MNQNSTPQGWKKTFRYMMSEKARVRGCPHAWDDLPEEEKAVISDLVYMIFLKARNFGLDTACEFVFQAGAKLATMPLPSPTGNGAQQGAQNGQNARTQEKETE